MAQFPIDPCLTRLNPLLHFRPPKPIYFIYLLFILIVFFLFVIFFLFLLVLIIRKLFLTIIQFNV